MRNPGTLRDLHALIHAGALWKLCEALRDDRETLPGALRGLGPARSQLCPGRPPQRGPAEPSGAPGPSTRDRPKPWRSQGGTWQAANTLPGVGKGLPETPLGTQAGWASPCGPDGPFYAPFKLSAHAQRA